MRHNIQKRRVFIDLTAKLSETKSKNILNASSTIHIGNRTARPSMRPRSNVAKDKVLKPV